MSFGVEGRTCIFVRVVYEIAAIEKPAATEIENDSAVILRIDGDDSVKTDMPARRLIVVPSLTRGRRHALEFGSAPIEPQL